MSTYTTQPGDVTIIFQQDGSIILSIGEGEDLPLGEIIKRINQRNIQSMLSGDANKIRAAEACAIAVGMIINPTLHEHMIKSAESATQAVIHSGSPVGLLN